MRLLCHNVLRNTAKGVVDGYPLKIEAAQIDVGAPVYGNVEFSDYHWVENKVLFGFFLPVHASITQVPEASLWGNLSLMHPPTRPFSRRSVKQSLT